MANAEALDSQLLATAMEALPRRRPFTGGKSAPLTLRITGGLHAGGEHGLLDGQRLLIGSAPECDIVLADEQVRPRHCELGRQGRTLSVRTVGGPVLMATGELAVGNLQALPMGAALGIGEAELRVAAPEDWVIADRRGTSPEGSVAGRGTILWKMSAAGFTVAAVSLLGAAALMGQEQQHAPRNPEVMLNEASSVIRQLALNELQTAIEDPAKAPAKVRVSGVVPDPAAKDALRSTLQSRAVPAEVDVRTGTDIAEDVREVLRLSGVDSQTRYLDNGRVEAKARFGDQQRLSQLIQSRAMSEVDGLRQVVAHNVDAAPVPEPEPIGAPKAVKFVVAGNDPYVVTRDGSRYYPGARLPNGEELVTVEGSNLLVSKDGHTESRPGAGTRLDTPQLK